MNRRAEITMRGLEVEPRNPQPHEAMLGDPADREIAVLILRARHHAMSNDDQAAITTLRTTADRASSARLQQKIGSLALGIARRLIWSNPPSTPALTGTGLDAAKTAVFMLPANPSAWHCYAQALGQADRPRDALTAYDRALALDPGNAGLHIGKGNSLRSIGRNDEALMAYDHALKVDPDSDIARISRENLLSNLVTGDDTPAGSDVTREGLRQLTQRSGRAATEPGFRHRLALTMQISARSPMASLLWKAALVLGVTLGGAGAVAGIVVGGSPAQIASASEVAVRLAALNNYHAVRDQFKFDFTYTVHKGFLFFTGESIHIAGKGTDDAIVDFSDVQVSRTGSSSVRIILPEPYLGIPKVNLKTTQLTEEGGVLTHLSHVISSDPNDARDAINAAQARISAAAGQSNLIETAQANARAYLVKTLYRLGYKHVVIIFI